jgi:hypothetical protein
MCQKLRWVKHANQWNQFGDRIILHGTEINSESGNVQVKGHLEQFRKMEIKLEEMHEALCAF